MRTIEEAREFWANIAKANGWYQEPFYIQVWLNSKGEIADCVSTRGLTADIVELYEEEEASE